MTTTKMFTNANTDGIINKLVTVFAFILCSLDNNRLGDKPGFPPLPIETSVTGDNNWRGFNLVQRHCTSAPRSLCNCGQHMARIIFVPRHSQNSIKFSA